MVWKNWICLIWGEVVQYKTSHTQQINTWKEEENKLVFLLVQDKMKTKGL